MHFFDNKKFTTSFENNQKQFILEVSQSLKKNCENFAEIFFFFLLLALTVNTPLRLILQTIQNRLKTTLNFLRNTQNSNA